MSVVVNLDTETAKLREKIFDFLLSRVPTHVAQFFVLVSGQDLVNDACKFVSNSNFGFVF